MPEIDPPEPEPENGDSADVANVAQNDILSRPAHQKTLGRMQKFVDAYRQTGVIRTAAEMARISARTHYRKLREDPVYRVAFEQAEEEVGGLLEDLAVERVREGNRRLVLYQGQPVTVNGEFLYEVEYDHHLHHVLLKRFKRELYKERVEQQISGEITIVARIGAARKRVLEMNRSAQNPDANDLAG